MKQHLVSVLFFLIVISGCSSPKEYVMPYINFGINGTRFFPTAENDNDFIFRAWVSVSTSIDRVFTIYRQENGHYVGKLLEIRRRNFLDTIYDRTDFKETYIKPRCGFKEFVLKVDSLKLLEMKGQDSSVTVVATDQPISLFVLEIKYKGKFNHFRFNTYYPSKVKAKKKYQDIQDLIFKELPFKLYVNKRHHH